MLSNKSAISEKVKVQEEVAAVAMVRDNKKAEKKIEEEEGESRNGLYRPLTLPHDA